MKIAPEIIERVKEFQKQAAAKAGESVEKITGELNDILPDARQDRAHSAAVAAVQAKSNILGLVVEKQEVGKPGDFSSVKSSHELAELVLKDIDPDCLLPITDEMRQQALSELDRHPPNRAGASGLGHTNGLLSCCSGQSLHQ
jgi:hypothetical protein